MGDQDKDISNEVSRAFCKAMTKSDTPLFVPIKFNRIKSGDYLRIDHVFKDDSVSYEYVVAKSSANKRNTKGERCIKFAPYFLSTLWAANNEAEKEGNL